MTFDHHSPTLKYKSMAFGNHSKMWKYDIWPSHKYVLLKSIIKVWHIMTTHLLKSIMKVWQLRRIAHLLNNLPAPLRQCLQQLVQLWVEKFVDFLSIFQHIFINFSANVHQKSPAAFPSLGNFFPFVQTKFCSLFPALNISSTFQLCSGRILFGAFPMQFIRIN